MDAAAGRQLRLWMIAGEESGDQLGAKVMRALRARLPDTVLRFEGVGGRAMAGEGVRSLFPISEINLMGIGAVLARLPALVRRVHQTVNAIVAAEPDALVIIDSPDFTHAVAARVRRRRPDIPIINYVSPSVWAWRPGRARRMRAYVDHVLALKPFEPEAHRRLGGPACTYVGHPLIEQVDQLRPGPGERRPLAPGSPVDLLVLPGSRRSEIARLMEPFGAALGLLRDRGAAPLSVTVPAVSHLAEEIEGRARTWPVPARVVRGENEKWTAFRGAQAALAASGTVTLELALSGVPMVVAYRVSKLEEQIKHFIKVPSIVLTNLILEENAIPERVQWDCTPEKLADALAPLLSEGPERRAQADAFARLDALMSTGAETPSQRAARVVHETIQRRQATPERTPSPGGRGMG
jgi:lipid-A-disaccharide synthase